MIVERVEHPSWLSNAYLVADETGGQGVLIDGNGMTEPLLERAEREVRIPDPEHGGEPHALDAPEPPDELGDHLGAERGVVERAGEPERVDVGPFLGSQVQLDRPRQDADAGAREVAGQQRRVEVLEPAEADDADRAAAAQVAVSHRLWHHRRRPRDADRGRQQQVLLDAAHVGVRRQ